MKVFQYLLNGWFHLTRIERGWQTLCRPYSVLPDICQKARYIPAIYSLVSPYTWHICINERSWYIKVTSTILITKRYSVSHVIFVFIFIYSCVITCMLYDNNVGILSMLYVFRELWRPLHFLWGKCFLCICIALSIYDNSAADDILCQQIENWMDNLWKHCANRRNCSFEKWLILSLWTWKMYNYFKKRSLR